jgi:hypothetical protein
VRAAAWRARPDPTQPRPRGHPLRSPPHRDFRPARLPPPVVAALVASVAPLWKLGRGERPRRAGADRAVRDPSPASYQVGTRRTSAPITEFILRAPAFCFFLNNDIFDFPLFVRVQHMELEGLQQSLPVRRNVWPCIGSNPWFRLSGRTGEHQIHSYTHTFLSTVY